jgi:hypothetical protein
LSRLGGLKGDWPEIVRHREDFAETLWQSDWSPEIDETAPANTDVAKEVISSLSFESIDYRGDTIQEAYDNTYEWIFSEADRTTARPSHPFPSWLEADTNDIFWITGKPGSGKSTLVKFLLHHPALKRHLQAWAGEREVVIANYYFWAGGQDHLQKCREGMMRTLLLRCLDQFPHLTRAVCPRRYALHEAFKGKEITPPSWTLEELLEALANLVQSSETTIRLAMFIDGLDEFDGAPEDLVRFIVDLNRNLSVKICVSCRPWIEFSESLGGSPKVVMQDLTAKDIETFIDGHFSTCKGYLERQALSPEDTTSLRLDVLQRAEGVFLWVNLVVKTLVRAFTNGAPLMRVRSILDELPSELKDLYSRLWNGMETGNMADASRYLLLKLHCRHLSTTLLWLADGEELPDLPDEKFDDFLEEKEGWGITDQIRRRLDSCTRGILSVGSMQGIDFVHRSARDWALTDDIRTRLFTALGTEFDPNMVLFRALVSALGAVVRFARSHGQVTKPCGEFYAKHLIVCFFYA